MSRFRKAGVSAVIVLAVAFGASAAFLGGTAETPARAAGNSIVGRPAPLSGKLIVDAEVPPVGTARVEYTGSAAECDFLHQKYPGGVPQAGCVNTATFSTTGATRTVRLCSAYSCDAWHAGVDFELRQDGPVLSASGGICHYGGFAYDALKDWVSYTGNGTGTVSVAADFYVIIAGIPITVEWHVRITNRAGGSWHVSVQHT
ncbi:hypothetical protein ACFWY9_29805 [Amycolatopsis sp. NPDC059027]|uniref:hypothetical protein n=1 Tax=unclassified Amycolatopsis TaxID=2618356 RepID=UPI0036735578